MGSAQKCFFISSEAAPQINGYCSSMAKTINMLQHLKQESYILQVDQGIQVFGKLSLASSKVSKTTDTFGAFSNHCVKTPGCSQLLLLDIAMGEYYIFLIRALI